MTTATTRHPLRNLRVARGPVALEQTRGGLILAAVLIACWQLSTPARADIPPWGYSMNEYFRLEWYYGLEDGTGLIRLRHWAWDWDLHDLILEHASFTTAGVTLDFWGDGHGLFGPPTYVGDDDGGRPLFEYELQDPVLLPWGGRLDIEITYPSQGVELRATEFSFEGRLSAYGGPIIPIPPGDMPFVTIQTIPELPALAMLGLGAAALATVRHRRGREQLHTWCSKIG